ncbi:MAG: hypothetical protein PVJ34_15905 [Anaerolineae bacterium]|jgi:hypothetical protein
MLEFIDEAVNVEVQAEPDGRLRPLAFWWQERRFQITSWGRESRDEVEGRAVHLYLVQTAGPESWELSRDVASGQWTLVRRWRSKYQAV